MLRGLSRKFRDSRLRDRFYFRCDPLDAVIDGLAPVSQDVQTLRLKKSGALIIPITGGLEVDMMTRYLFSGTDKEFMSIERYSIYKSPKNDVSIF